MLRIKMDGLNQNEKIIWSCWEAKTPREVVREAAAKGTHIKLAEKFLMNKNGWSEDIAQEWFHAEVCAWILQLLSRKQIFKVLHILNKVQIVPEKHLMNLARESVEIEFRDYIVEQLNKISESFKDEYEKEWIYFNQHWNLLRYLEKSFEADGTFKQNKVFGSGTDRVVVNESEVKALTIDKIEKYPEQWKSKVAVYLFFYSFEFSLLNFSTPLTLWNHLLEHNKAMILVRWINMHTSEVVRDMNARYNFFNSENFIGKILNVDSQGLPANVLEPLDERFRKWPIDDEMIANVAISNCFMYTKMCIYDTLCSYGIVVEDEKKNLHAIVSRLARTQNLKIVDDIFTESCSTITKRDFYVELAKYCIKNKLYSVLTACVDGDVLGSDLSDVEDDARDCIELWLLFKSIQQTSDRQSHVLPIYKTCQQIANKDIDNYISANPHLVLGMILLDDDKQLFDIFTNSDVIEFKDFVLPNKCSSNRLPHLLSVYKKYTSLTGFAVENDVNVYQLLSGYRGLDVSKLFDFQLLNNQNVLVTDQCDRRSLGSLLSDAANINVSTVLPSKSAEIPHFANEKLMKRYGYLTKLNHVYYLKHFRPCTASQAFVMHQYQLYNRLQDKSIKNACCEAHGLALENWNDPAMAACNVSFIAMIGCNPVRCRVHMSAARMMKEYILQNKEISMECALKVVNDYMSKLCHSNKADSVEILHFLEEITIHNIESKLAKSGEEMDMSVIIFESQTIVKFALVQGIPLPEVQLRRFIDKNFWFHFLLFGDVFRYPQQQMLELSQEFENKSYAEHLKHIIMHRNMDDISNTDKDNSKSTANMGHRRLSRLSSSESSPTKTCSFEYPELAGCGGDLWEVISACHGPDDPPGALVRAAGFYHAPILALAATCYEPNAAGVLWAYWLLATLGDAVPNHVRDALKWDISEQYPPEDEFQQIMELCLEGGYVRTLHESMLIFFADSPMTMLTAFLCRSMWQRSFDPETTKLLFGFTQYCQRKYSSVGVDNSPVPWVVNKHSLQVISVALVRIALSQGFDSALHQKEFLRCLVDTQFGKDFTVPCPDFSAIYIILKISMETPSVINVAKLLKEDSDSYLSQFIEALTANQNYAVALDIAKISGIPVSSILIAEWSHKYDEIVLKAEDMVECKDRTLFIASCSKAFKKAAVPSSEAIPFLSSHIKDIDNHVQKFYSCKIILSWFDDNLLYGTEREEIEHEMWNSYFRTESLSKVFLNDYDSTLQFVLNEQKHYDAARKLSQMNSDRPIGKLLSEIKIESDILNIQKVLDLADRDMVDVWRKTVGDLLELKLMVDAFRLSAMFKVPLEHQNRSPCPVQIVSTCLSLAEGTCTPYDLPQELRLVIASPSIRNRLSASETSDTSFEELVVIPEKQEDIVECATHLAGREDADRLSALEALAARSGITVAKQVASFYRIALQVGWPYTNVLKYQGNPVDFINYVSGRARMSLANLVFRTYNVSSKQIADYLSLEMVAAIISPHLVKTSAFRQKEHFQYTLWGYPLNSDIEMFLNMRPDACSLTGRLMLDHLMAFRKIYKCHATSRVPDDTFDDSSIDLETLIDEEYQTVENDEIETITTESSMTDGAETINSHETESVFSASTVYSYSNKLTRESRRNLFDVISKSNVHIPYEVKANIRRITKGAKLTTKQVSVISIELLVLAHECFSCACDTEGIAVVLRSAQALTGHLLWARSWRLMVRLLTGLARYTEMAYVFQMLRNNHQFEFLLGQFDYMLGQQQDKITEFKQGLLDFLRNHCPGDTETYCMVALHFSMYCETANVKKKQANDLITNLEKMALDSAKANSKKPFQPPQWLMIYDNSSTRLLLENALNHCTDAAELYLQGGCMGLAGEMANLAQQIALQISLLNASPTRLILNRSTEQLYTLVSDYLSLMEGLVLLSGRGAAQWRELAYRRVLRNDQAYLRDLMAYRPDVAFEVLQRYKTEKKTTTVSQAAITELKSLCQ